MNHETDDTYLTLQGESQGIYKEKGSKFLSFAYPVKDEDEIKEILARLKKQYYDARHHCYAYVLGRDQQDFRANDDGEPTYSAGEPILGQIRANQLTNVLIVVVRYFGAIKLGIGGLIIAYRAAAAEAISANTIITELVMEQVKFTFDYEDMNDVMRLIKEDDLQIVQQDFQNHCTIILAVREALIQKARNRLSLIPSVILED